VLIRFNKPFQVLCQFTDSDAPESNARKTLADYIDIADVYAAGRLDKDSEGLLLLTNDGRLQHRISHPRHKLPKTYCVQVDGEVDDTALQSLANGVVLKDGPTAACEVTRIDEPDWLWPRDPPVRFRQSIPTSWLQITLREGRNRQVRRMTAAVGYPTLRLIRYSIGGINLSGLNSGRYEVCQASKL